MPWAVLVFHNLLTWKVTRLMVSMSLEYTSWKLIFLGLSYRFKAFHLTQSFKRWFSSSTQLQMSQFNWSVPWKFFPHSSNPYLAIIIVFVSCFVVLRMEVSGCLLYVSCVILDRIDAVFVFTIFYSNTFFTLIISSYKMKIMSFWMTVFFTFFHIF